MKTKLLLAILPLVLFTSCANSQGDVFGRKADTGAIVGGMIGTVVGAYNGNPLKGALIGAGVGLGAGAIADANDSRQQNTSTVYREQYVRQPEVVVVQHPIVIEERVWVGPTLWIYTYRGHRDAHGRIFYHSRAPFGRRPAFRH
jgi:hypothetical protein